jgi:hypothetical protein
MITLACTGLRKETAVDPAAAACTFKERSLEPLARAGRLELPNPEPDTASADTETENAPTLVDFIATAFLAVIVDLR